MKTRINTKSIIMTVLIIAVVTIFHIALYTPQMANASGFLAHMGCDLGPDGKIDALKCLTEGKDGRVISFVDFEGELAPPDPSGYVEGLVQATDARSYILNVTNYFLGFLGLVAVIIIIYGGVQYVLSAGKPEEAGKGKKTIMFTVVGILLILSSFAIVNTVLLAPSDNEGGSVGVGVRGDIRGVAENQRFNYLAREIERISQDIIGNYIFHISLRNQIEVSWLNVKTEVELQNVSCVPPMDTCLNSFVGTINLELNKIHNFVGQRYSTSELSGELNKMINELRSENAVWQQKTMNRIIEKGCDRTNVGISFRACTPDKRREIIQDLEAKKNEIEKLFGSISPFLSAENNEIAKSHNNNLKNARNSLINIQTAVKEMTGAEASLAQNGFERLSNLGDSGILDRLLKSPNFNTTIASENELRDIINYLGEIYNILINIKSVYVALSSDVAEGNAPLTVNFSTVGSIDPSGRSITAERILWDLNGNGNFNEGSISEDNFLECVEKNEATTTCTFMKAGTYRVAAKILPHKDFSNEIAPSISYLNIKVNPPATKIDLKVNGEPVMKYDNDGFLELDKLNVYVTLFEARNGIRFDASSSNNNLLIKDQMSTVKWHFGIDSPNNDTMQLPAEGLTKTQVYNEKGKYLIKLEIADRNKVIDRKIFNLIVSDLAPRISNPQRFGKVGEEVVFDGSASSFQSGSQSVTYDWKVEKIQNTALIKEKKLLLKKANAQNNDYNCSQMNNEKMTCTFLKSGNFRISLTLTNNGETQTENTTIRIYANKPVAGFSTFSEYKSLPSLIKLDASALSFDSDNPSGGELEYSWQIQGDNCFVIPSPKDGEKIEDMAMKSSQKPCSELANFSKENKVAYAKFNKKGDYSISLIVRTPSDVENLSDPSIKTVRINNVLDLNWSSETQTTAKLDSMNGVPSASIEFKFLSPLASSFEIDFGDGEKSSGPISEEERSQGVKVVHNYQKAGKNNVKLTVYDIDDSENSISRNIYIGDSENPLAIITTLVDGNEIPVGEVEVPDCGTVSNAVLANKKSTLSFDSSRSVNVDGTARNLRYSWDINNGEKKGTRPTIAHQFREQLNCKNGKMDYYTVLLSVTNDRDPSKKSEDSVNIVVLGERPEVSSLVAIPDATGGLITPVKINLKAIGATDSDGRIVQYRWWYADVNDSSEQKGIQITVVPEANLIIGTNGNEGEKRRYTFGLEVTDDDNLKSSTLDGTLRFNLPTIEVTNGPNKPPVARFSVDRTSVFVGESVNFTSSSFDPDNDALSYNWSFGDGTFAESKATVSHKYQKPSSEGYLVRLTVKDSNGSEASANPIRVFVDSTLPKPIARFTHRQIGETKAVTLNASQSFGSSLIYTWICDSDLNSNPMKGMSVTCNYRDYGTYRVKLIVQDPEGQSNEIIQIVNVQRKTQVSTIDSNELGANLFKASNSVSPTLLLLSLFAYGVLMYFGIRNKKTKQNK